MHEKKTPTDFGFPFPWDVHTNLISTKYLIFLLLSGLDLIANKTNTQNLNSGQVFVAHGTSGPFVLTT